MSVFVALHLSHSEFQKWHVLLYVHTQPKHACEDVFWEDTRRYSTGLSKNHSSHVKSKNTVTVSKNDAFKDFILFFDFIAFIDWLKNRLNAHQ
jgi:hypothetical protein